MFFLPADVLTFRTVRRAIGGRISDRFEGERSLRMSDHRDGPVGSESELQRESECFGVERPEGFVEN